MSAGHILIQISDWIPRKGCESQCFFDFAGELGLFAAAFFAGGAFLGGGAGFAAGVGCGFAVALPAGTAAALAAAGAGSPLPFFFPGPGCWAACAAAWAAAFAPRPRFGVGGGGGGGGANGFRKFKRSVRERSLPSSNNRKTSSAIFAYSGSWGVMSSSVISGKGIFCCTSRHLVKKFLIFCSTACCRAVTARNKVISGRALESSFQVREGVAASLLVSRLASDLALSSRSRQASTRSLRGISLRMSAMSLSASRLVRK